MLINYFLIGLSGLSLAMFLVFIVKKFSIKHNTLVLNGIPLTGGIALGLSFIFTAILGFLLCQGFSQAVIGIIIVSMVMLIFGIIDDWKELSVRNKFLVQLIATSLLILFGVRTQIVYIGTTANIIITFIWMLGIMNAFNLLDVLDGLAGGIALIVGSAFFVISVLSGDIVSGILSLSVVVIALGFLFYNFPPANIYMGNSGSHFLGFVLAAIALLISYAPMERKVALLSPVLILGFPIFDTAFLILARVIKKTLPFKKSNDHLVLRFLALNYPKRKALLVMLGLCLFFCLCGILLSQVPNFLGIIILLFVIFISLLLTKRMIKVAV